MASLLLLPVGEVVAIQCNLFYHEERGRRREEKALKKETDGLKAGTRARKDTGGAESESENS
jgi:hypothetical protein